MADSPEPVQPVGYVRQIAGRVIIGLGLFVWADMAFLLFFPRLELRAGTLLGLGLWLWVGLLLVLAGEWAACRSPTAGKPRLSWALAGWLMCLPMPFGCGDIR